MSKIASVFISHSAQEPDHFVTRSLATGLQDVGFSVWWDEDGLEGGDFFAVEILEAIIRQRQFLFVISPRSITSKWCQRELIRATELGKEIIPLMLEQVPTERLPLEIAGIQYVNIGRGVQESLPSILKALGVGERASTPALEDPFARDGQLVQAIADQLPYAKSFTDSLNMVMLLQNIGLSCCQTDRAREIFAGMRGPGNWSSAGGMRRIDYDKVRSYLLQSWA